MECIWTGFLIGCFSFAHCLGMCGGFALHLSGGGRAAVLGRQLLWHAGKTASYMFLGALAAFAGGQLVLAHGRGVQMALTWIAGGVMIVSGLALLGVRLALTRPIGPPSPIEGEVNYARTRGRQTDGLLVGFVRQFFGSAGWRSAMAMGLATGLLPCGIVYSALAVSLQSGSVLVGMATMAAMGAGTMWSLLVIGLTGGLLSAKAKRWGAVAGGIVLVLLGSVTALRGSHVLHSVLPAARPVMRDQSATNDSSSAAQPSHSCCEASSQP